MQKPLIACRALEREFPLVLLQMVVHCALKPLRLVTDMADIETLIVFDILVGHLNTGYRALTGFQFFQGEGL